MNIDGQRPRVLSPRVLTRYSSQGPFGAVVEEKPLGRSVTVPIGVELLSWHSRFHPGAYVRRSQRTKISTNAGLGLSKVPGSACFFSRFRLVCLDLSEYVSLHGQISKLGCCPLRIAPTNGCLDRRGSQISELGQFASGRVGE